MRDQIIPFSTIERIGRTTIHRGDDLKKSELDRKLLIASTCSDVAAFISTVNTSTYSVGVKFFWTGLKADADQMLCHVRISSKDSKFQSINYHIWMITILDDTDLEDDEDVKGKPHNVGGIKDDEKSATISRKS